MIRKLRLKFIAVVMTLVLLMLGAIFTLVLIFMQAGLEHDSISMLQSIAAIPPRQQERLGELPGARGENIRLPYFTVALDRHGEPVAFGGGYYDLSDEGFLLELLDAALSTGEQLGVLEDYGLRYCVSPAPEERYVVFADMSSELNTIDNLRRTCLAIGVLSLAAFLVIAVFLSRWIVKPVEEAWRQQRQFVADASHELKTPLTIIMANAELLQSGAGGEVERSRFSAAILTVSRRMRALVEQLLELARMDSAIEPPALEPLALSELTAEAVLPFEPVIFERGLSLETDIADGITVCGDAEQLRQVVDILLDNAQKYASEGGLVRVELKRLSRTRAQLCVADSGEPISEEALAQLFKRFYRADEARSGEGSFGLGLAIAQSIVERHSGRIWAESRGGFNRFFVELPCCG